MAAKAYDRPMPCSCSTGRACDECRDVQFVQLKSVAAERGVRWAEGILQRRPANGPWPPYGGAHAFAARAQVRDLTTDDELHERLAREIDTHARGRWMEAFIRCLEESADDPCDLLQNSAAAEFASRGLVCFFVESTEEDSSRSMDPLGSGTIWRGENGRTAILTAKHFLEGHTSFAMLTGNRGPAFHIKNALIEKHDDLDVAVVHFDTAGADLSAISYPVTALDERNKIDRGDVVLVAGFPEHMSTTREVTDPAGKRWTVSWHLDFRHFAFVAGSDDELISIEWRAGKIEPIFADAFEAFGIKPGQHHLRAPWGISGGATWRYLPAPTEGTWTTESRLRFVGVPVSWNTQKQHAVPVWLWRDWFLNQFR